MSCARTLSNLMLTIHPMQALMKTLYNNTDKLHYTLLPFTYTLPSSQTILLSYCSSHMEFHLPILCLCWLSPIRRIYFPKLPYIIDRKQFLISHHLVLPSHQIIWYLLCISTVHTFIYTHYLLFLDFKFFDAQNLLPLCLYPKF